MSRDRDLIGDAGTLLTLAQLFVLYQLAQRWDALWKREPWWTPEYTDKGGRGAGPGSSTQPVPQGGANVWSEDTMRLFAREMAGVPVDARLVLLGIGAASHFNADEEMGDNVGLLLVRRSDLAAVGVPIPETFGVLNAPEQIPWIAQVIALRMADRGGKAPASVADLAVLLHPTSSPTIEQVIRKEAERRAEDARGQSIYLNHDNLLRHVLANP